MRAFAAGCAGHFPNSDFPIERLNAQSQRRINARSAIWERYIEAFRKANVPERSPSNMLC